MWNYPSNKMQYHYFPRITNGQEQAELEAREAVKKNVTRRMGWFDMLRRLEKKVTNGMFPIDQL